MIYFIAVNKYFINIHSPIKLKLRIPYVSNENCTKILEGFGVRLGPKQICAGGEFAKDTCAGDSGGPLMYFDRQHSRWVAYGVVSYGFTQCGMAGKPAVYTNVAEYTDWIDSVVQQRKKSQQTQAKMAWRRISLFCERNNWRLIEAGGIPIQICLPLTYLYLPYLYIFC